MVDWGNVPGWIAAVATTLGLLVAGGAGGIAYRQLRAVVAAEKERADDAMKTQARRVASWLEIGDDDLFHVYVVNRSDLPIYKVILTFVSPNNFNEINLQTVAPRDDPWEPKTVSDLVNDADRMHSPRFRLSYPMSLEQPGTLKAPGGVEVGPTGPIGVTLTFSDASSRRWHRDMQGDLTRVGATDVP